MKKDIRKYLPWIILAVLVISLSVWYLLSRRVTQEQISLYDSRVSEAQAHVEAMQFSVAMQKYYEAVEIIPNELDAYQGILDILILKNRLADAQKVIEQSAKPLNSAKKSKLYQKVGDAYFEKGNYSKADEMYDAGSFLGVNNMELELMLGKTYINLGKINDAKSQLGKSGYQDELLEEANLLLSYIYALEDKSKAKSPLNATAEVVEMEIYYDEFETILDRLDDDEKFNAAKLSRVYINNGYPFLAIQVLEPLRDEITEYLEGMYFLGRAYFENKQYDKAIETLDSALTLGGMEQEMFWLRARSYFLTNDLDNSISSYDSAIANSHARVPPELLKEYVNLLLENNQLLKASHLLRGVQLIEGERTYFKLLALEVNYNLKEYVRLEYYIDQLANAKLNNAEEEEFLVWRIKILLENEQLDEDEKEQLEVYMDRLFELNRFSPHYRLYLAKSQMREGENELAKQSLEQAIEYDLEYAVSEEALRLLSSLR